MVSIINLDSRRRMKLPPLDDLLCDEFIARRAIRAGIEFDPCEDDLTIPFESLYPLHKPRRPATPRLRAGADADASPENRQPRFFIEARAAAIFAFELLVLVGSIAAVAGILLLVGASS